MPPEATVPIPRIWKLRFEPHDVLLYCKQTEPPVDIRYIAHKLGIDVREIEDPGWAAAAKRVDVRRVIWVPKTAVELRKRFAIAHMLGHMIHRPVKEVFVEKDFQDKTKDEQKANQFTSELLVPKAMLVTQLVRVGPKRALLADAFQVSETLLETRLEAFQACL